MTDTRDDPYWVGGGSGDVAENTEWARDIATEWGQRVICRVDRRQARTNDGTRLLWDVFLTKTTVDEARAREEAVHNHAPYLDGGDSDV